MKQKDGFVFIEILTIVCIGAIFLLSSTFFFNKSLREAKFKSICGCIVETLATAKSLAENEGVPYTVVFDNDSFVMYREGTRIGKVFLLPSGTVIREKTSGFSPVVFLPDGTAREAGSMLLEEKRIKKRARLSLYNLTGKVIVREEP